MAGPTIKDLLASLQADDNSGSSGNLANTKENWAKIKNKEFSDLGLEGSELDAFLSEWIENNPYSKAL